MQGKGNRRKYNKWTACLGNETYCVSPFALLPNISVDMDYSKEQPGYYRKYALT